MASFDTNRIANDRQQPPISSCGNGSVIPGPLGGRCDQAPGIANDPDAERMLGLIRGGWVSQIIGTLAKLGLADRLVNGPLSLDTLAEATGCNPDALHRLLRAAASYGLLVATSDGAYRLTQLGEKLTSHAPGSLRDLAIAATSPGLWLPWGRLVDAVRHGERQTMAALGREFFAYYGQNPDEGAAFTGAMANRSREVAQQVAGVLDTSAAGLVADIGGASGTIIAALLEQNPALQGVILELPEVAPRARAAMAQHGLSHRCEVVEGNFFEAVPEADIHILKWIIHDWDDEQAVQILSNCVRTLRRNGRIVLIECVLAEDSSSCDAAFLDLTMLVTLPGRERTARQYDQLLRRAGLRIDRFVDLHSSMQLVEASADGADGAQ